MLSFIFCCFIQVVCFHTIRQKLRLITSRKNDYNLMGKFFSEISLFLKERMIIWYIKGNINLNF